MKILKKINATVTNRCPRCLEGRVFENNNPYSFKNGLTMKNTCTACGLKYEMETGFFYGAMYVAYGLVAGLFILFFALDAFWLHLDPMLLFGSFSVVILVIFPLTFRWSRVMWISFFVKYDPEASRRHIHRH
jgi:uncharacterized protein (DUF983 family)